MKPLFFLCTILSVGIAMGQSKKPIENISKTELSIEEPITEGQPHLAPVEVLKDENYIYSTNNIQVKPEFPEGKEAMYSFIRKNYVVPQAILDQKKNRKVFVSFVVEKDGRLSDLKVLREVGFDTGKEALRVLALMPKWQPGENEGKPIRCRYAIPILLNAE